MTPFALRHICELLNPGGQTKQARLLDWNPSTVRRKLSGISKITQANELAIQQVLARALLGIIETIQSARIPSKYRPD